MAPNSRAGNSRGPVSAGGDRDKSLEIALAQIERQFGKGSVMRLGDETRTAIDVIPTGSISLDVALGVGGFPRGRIVEIYGPESSGKCVTAGTLVWTDRGLETVAEIFGRAGLEATCTTRVTDIRDLGIRLLNERGELETVAALTHNGAKPVLRLQLRSGRAITLTRNHPLRVVSERGVVVWRQAGQIAAGDTVVSALFGAVEAAAGDGISEDEAVFLGYLVAEGAQCAELGEAASGEYAGLAEGLFGDRLDSATVREFLAREYGVESVGAAATAVPARIRTAGHKAQRAFLSALFESDGWIDPTSAIGLETVSDDLARQVQLLLFGFGIAATVTSKDAGGDESAWWSVTISPSDAQQFLDEVGFRSGRREAPAAGGRVAGSRDSRYAFEEVVAIDDAGLEPTFDVVMPQSHSFVANGMLSHNTTVALHAVANAQKNGGIAAFIDAEHALDPEYARKLGVDIDALLVSQPDTGEQALEIADMLIRSGAIDVIVIDSVAALVPKAEIEGEMGDSHVGLQARLMSQALRKIAGALNQTKTTAIFINQLREKIGVMFGCMQYDTRITLADGSQEKIGKIVNQRMNVEVLSYDPATGKVVPRKIANWFNNGPADRFLQFTVAKSGGNGLAQFAATGNHLVRTPGGWRAADQLIAGDRLLITEPYRLSDQQIQVVLGSLMGDGNLSPNTRGRSGTRFRLGHGAKQAAYLDWKVSLLGNIECSRTVNAKGAVFADFTPLPELAELHDVVYLGDGKKHLSDEYLKALTPLALAIWYMDDGCFTLRSKGLQERTRGGSGRIDICVEAMSPGTRGRLVQHLRDSCGLDVKLLSSGRQQKAVLQFTTSATAKFQQLVAPYVHPSMEYKLLPRFRGQFSVQPEFAEPELRLVPARILDIHVKPPTRSMNRFDIEVEGHHNYFVDGVMVHNSPETTSGGKALKFYATIRLDIRRIETLKDGTDAVGNRTRVKVVKNKVSPPFRTAEMDILYGIGISREGGLIDVGVEQGIVRKSGAWYTYEGEQLGQGKENARKFLRDNPDLASEIERKIKDKLGVPAPGAEDAAAAAAVGLSLTDKGVATVRSLRPE